MLLKQSNQTGMYPDEMKIKKKQQKQKITKSKNKTTTPPHT